MRLNELIEDRHTPFQSYRDVEWEHWREYGDCAIIAVSIACNVSYEKAFETLNIHERGRNNYEGYTSQAVKRSVRALGYEFEAINPDYYLEKVRKMAIGKIHGNEMTLGLAMYYGRYGRLFDDELQHNQIWWVSPPHVIAFKNGKIEGYPIGDEVREIIDVFKPGQKPVRNEQTQYEVKDFVVNYVGGINKYMKLYNEKIIDKYHINYEEATAHFEYAINMMAKHKVESVSDPLDTRFTRRGRDERILIRRNDNGGDKWNVEVT